MFRHRVFDLSLTSHTRNIACREIEYRSSVYEPSRSKIGSSTEVVGKSKYIGVRRSLMFSFVFLNRQASVCIQKCYHIFTNHTLINKFNTTEILSKSHEIRINTSLFYWVRSWTAMVNTTLLTPSSRSLSVFSEWPTWAHWSQRIRRYILAYPRRFSALFTRSGYFHIVPGRCKTTSCITSGCRR